MVDWTTALGSQAPTLEGRLVRLEPMVGAHREDLRPAATEPAIWTYMSLDASADFDTMFDRALEDRAAGRTLPFVVRELADGRLVGSTRYINLAPVDRHLEIGWTWYAPDIQGGPVNPECKLLLLDYAFTTLGCYRVELRCDARNARSRRAISKLGAVQEGILRRHMVVQHDYVRDTVVYAILDSDWPGVKRGLERRLQEN